MTTTIYCALSQELSCLVGVVTNMLCPPVSQATAAETQATQHRDLMADGLMMSHDLDDLHDPTDLSLTSPATTAHTAGVKRRGHRQRKKAKKAAWSLTGYWNSFFFFKQLFFIELLLSFFFCIQCSVLTRLKCVICETWTESIRQRIELETYVQLRTHVNYNNKTT